MSTSELTINEPNLWRTKTPGHAGWPRSARVGDPRKYFIVSADAHANAHTNTRTHQRDGDRCRSLDGAR